MSEQDREDLRWYLEDHLQYPLDPAPKIAARIEGRIAEIGRDLFSRIFQSNDDARDLWATARTMGQTMPPRHVGAELRHELWLHDSTMGLQ